MEPFGARHRGSSRLGRAEQTSFVPSNLRFGLGLSRPPSCTAPVARRLHEGRAVGFWGLWPAALLWALTPVRNAPQDAPVREPRPLIKEDGAPFSDEEVASLSDELDALDGEDRVEARNKNAEAIAEHDADRMLVVSGPGTGKSTLFKKRLVHWLEEPPDKNVAVATFVRSLVRDLRDDIANDPGISAEDKKRIFVMTLHRHARSIIERNHRYARVTSQAKLRRHYR
jgi:AAA domain